MVINRKSEPRHNKAKSPLLKQVRRFLRPDSLSPHSSLELVHSSGSLTEYEWTKCLKSVCDCSTVSQLYLVISKLTRSHPTVSFHSIKTCLARLNKLKMAKNRNKSTDHKVQDNKKMIRRGKKAVIRFLEKNRPVNVA